MRLPRPEPRRVALAALSAVGMVLSCPNFDQFWLGFLMWIPYFAAIEGCKPRAAFGYGWLVGIITVFWTARIVIDALVFEHSDWPEGPLFGIGHTLLTSLFVFVALTGWLVLLF